MVLVPEQQVSVLDHKVDQANSCTYILLEWRRGIPACFRGANLQLTNNVVAHLVQLRVPDTHPEVTSQAALTEGTPVWAPMAVKEYNSLPLCENLWQSAIIHVYAGSSYPKLSTFLGDRSVPATEEGYKECQEEASPSKIAPLITILQDKLGRAEKASDLIYQLKNTYQREGEKLSELMWCLDKILYLLLPKKDID